MPIPASLTTQQMISAVYEWLGKPNMKVLPPSTVCVKLWAMLGKLQSKLNLSDKTIFLSSKEFTVGASSLEYELGEFETPFGSELGFEIVDHTSGVEVTEPVPLVYDIGRLSASAIGTNSGIAALLFRNPQTNKLTIRFSSPVADLTTFRLWFEPSVFARPKLEDKPVVPDEGVNLLIIETAFACLSEISKLYEPFVYNSYVNTVSTQKAEFARIYDDWSKKPKGGTPKRKAFNESRRGRNGRRYNITY